MVPDQSGSSEALMLEGIHVKERDHRAKQEAKAWRGPQIVLL